jgi:cleavage and polyadenylation specificity factor subunit 6/7
LRKHQVYIGNLTWWTSDRDIQETLADIGVHDFVEVKFYENRANGQSKGYCVLTVGSDSSLKLINDKFVKKEIHGQLPIVSPPTKQALNQFEAQSKTRPTPGQGNQGNMNMMGGPRGGPMGMGPQMGMGMGFSPRMMMGPIRGPRGMGPPGMGPPPHRNMGPPNQQGPPGSGNFSPQHRPMGPQSQLPPPPGPPQRPPPGVPMNSYLQGQPGPQGMPRGPMPGPMMDTRGPLPRQEWSPRPPMNSYPPHGQAPIPPPGPMPGPPVRGPQVAPQIMTGPPPPGAPAPHMNPAFFQPARPTRSTSGSSTYLHDVSCCQSKYQTRRPIRPAN